MPLRYLPLAELERIRAAEADPVERAAAFADACRINALYMIARAGSGHIGTSFSCMDILAWLHSSSTRTWPSSASPAPGPWGG
jgi:transketolase